MATALTVLGILVCAALGVFVCAVIVHRIFNPSATEEEVLEALSLVMWKSAHEVRDDIDYERGYSGDVVSVTIESVYEHLDTFLEEGSAESRRRHAATAEALAEYEFRLVPHGRRAHHDPHTRRPLFDVFPALGQAAA